MPTVQISHDPFARTCLMRQPASANGRECQWCGQRGKRLWHYYYQRDDATRAGHIATEAKRFCCVGCFRDYHG